MATATEKAARVARASTVPTGAVVRSAERWHDGRRERRDDCIAEEVPIALVYNDAPFAVMMATPADLEDFALGFSLTEGIIANAPELGAVKIAARLEGIELALTIPPERAALASAHERSIEGRSGCGVCGSRRLEDVVRPPAPVGVGPTIAARSLRVALEHMQSAQLLNAATGATHAAAWADANGQVLAVREDVGRHNALDKLIGGLARQGFDPNAGFALVTSRASYEMVLKAASVGIAFVAAVSAPTAMAIHLAQSCGMTLIGYARKGACSVYAHPQRYCGDQ